MLTGIVMFLGAIGIAAIFAVVAAAVLLALAFGAIAELRKRLRPARQTEEWLEDGDPSGPPAVSPDRSHEA